MQDGQQSFVARLRGIDRFLFSLPTSCRLELAGVYVIENGNQVLNRPGSSFAILLDSAADIKVLARPPWWTLRRLLIVVGMLAAVLLMAVLWINQLHRRVEERTDQLQEQIRKRQAIEQHRAMEQERARVAQDLHDELWIRSH